MKEKILDILEKHYHGRNHIESRCADELLGLFNVVGQSEQLPCDCSKHATYFDEEKKPRCKNCNQKSWLAR